MAAPKQRRSPPAEDLTQEATSPPAKRERGAPLLPPWHQLPIDIVDLIVSLAPVRPRLLALSLVCKRWRAAALRSVTVVTHRRDGDLWRALQLLPAVTALDLRSWRAGAALNTTSALRSVRLAAAATNAFRVRNGALLRAGLSRLPHLTSLSLAGVDTAAHATCVVNVLGALSTRLTSLALEGNAPELIVLISASPLRFPGVARLSMLVPLFSSAARCAQVWRTHFPNLQTLMLRTPLDGQHLAHTALTALQLSTPTGESYVGLIAQCTHITQLWCDTPRLWRKSGATLTTRLRAVALPSHSHCYPLFEELHLLTNLQRLDLELIADDERHRFVDQEIPRTIGAPLPHLSCIRLTARDAPLSAVERVVEFACNVSPALREVHLGLEDLSDKPDARQRLVDLLLDLYRAGVTAVSISTRNPQCLEAAVGRATHSGWLHVELTGADTQRDPHLAEIDESWR